ncbi:MAG: NAD(P)H-dependent oxidoreductase [Clostridium sp.]
MENVLFLDACIRAGSRTRRLCESCLSAFSDEERFCIAHLKLSEMELKSLNRERLEKREDFANPERLKTKECAWARQFADADYIVIGAPYYDLSFPSVLKTYIENIMFYGITFEYEHDASKGLCKAKKLIYLTTSGGIIGNQNFGYDYIKAVAAMIGIENSVCFSAEGLDIEGNDVEAIMTEAIGRIKI